MHGQYSHIRSGGAGYREMQRGLIAVLGKESVQFLNGMVTNDVAKLEEGSQMVAAFPNAQGRLLAVTRVVRDGGRFLFETEEATREKVYDNLFRFTLAGDFFVEDLSEQHRYFEIFGPKNDVFNPNVGEKFSGAFAFESQAGAAYFVPQTLADKFREFLVSDNGMVEISGELYELLRIEQGIPLYGVDMDETTIVPELGLEGLISYNKGCYVGQEIIARIHFRGHVAKQLTGVVYSGEAIAGDELRSADGKNAGRITSPTRSPALDKNIALAYIRYDYLEAGNELLINDQTAMVTSLPFIR